MEWTVTERDAGRNKSGQIERTWETCITITLPHLGKVSAQLVLNGSQVAVKLHAEDAGTVPKLETGRTRLSEQFEGAGLIPAEMSISHAPTR
jgi:hypothetical protein